MRSTGAWLLGPRGRFSSHRQQLPTCTHWMLAGSEGTEPTRGRRHGTTLLPRGGLADMARVATAGPGGRTSPGPAGRVGCSGSRDRRTGALRPVVSVHFAAVSYTHLRAHETRHDLVCR